MSLPHLTAEMRLSRDVELKYSANGMAMARIGLVSNSRKFNKESNEWEDDKVCWMTGTAFKKVAENAAHSLRKGDLVTVTGRLQTEEWEKDGQKKSATALVIDTIGLSLTFDSASKVEAPSARGGSQSSNPWGESGSGSGEPPF
jgi:single-strand DNA-binding protein